MTAPTYDQARRSAAMLTWTLENHGRMSAPVTDAEDALDRLAQIAQARIAFLGETDTEAISMTAALARRVNPALVALAARAADPVVPAQRSARVPAHV